LGYVEKLSSDPKGLVSPPEGRVGRGSRRIVDLGRSSVGYNACLGLKGPLVSDRGVPTKTSRVSSLVYWNLFFPSNSPVEFWLNRRSGLAGRFVLKNLLRAEHAKPRGRDFLSPLNDYHDIQFTSQPVRETTDCSAHTSRRTVGFLKRRFANSP
jgi:hypothetical protein